MTDIAAGLNAAIAAEAPALHAALSPVGRQVYFPREIPFQAAEARGAAYNATIGQITDGAGRPLALPAIEAVLSGLSPDDLAAAVLYSPIEGLPEVRARWRTWQRRDIGEAPPTTLPVVTAGLSHGIALAADLFGGPGKAVAVPTPFWGSYRHIFGLRGGSRILTAPLFRAGALNTGAIGEALADVPDGEPAVAVLNFPSNPGGYMPTADERRRICDDLLAQARRRPLVVICDDAYLGLVYEQDIPRTSMFWDLVGLHPNLAPIKVDGATKEFVFFGGRVGFVTFALPPESSAALALEDKLKGLIRASVGSPVAVGQVILLRALRDPAIEESAEGVRNELEGRYRVLKAALAGADHSLMMPLPFNAGCFALVELATAAGVTAETLRRHLLVEEDTGVIAIGERHIRLAFCSVSEAALPELVARVERGLAHLARRAAVPAGEVLRG